MVQFQIVCNFCHSFFFFMIFFLGSILRSIFSFWGKDNQWGVFFILVFPLLFLFIIYQEEVFFLESEIGCLNWSLRFLTFWTILIAIIILIQVRPGRKLFLTLYILILYSSFYLFNELNYFFFYVVFEIRVLPILLITFISGRSKFRLEAGLYLLIFTLFSALLLFISLFI